MNNLSSDANSLSRGAATLKRIAELKGWKAILGISSQLDLSAVHRKHLMLPLIVFPLVVGTVSRVPGKEKRIPKTNHPLTQFNPKQLHAPPHLSAPSLRRRVFCCCCCNRPNPWPQKWYPFPSSSFPATLISISRAPENVWLVIIKLFTVPSVTQHKPQAAKQHP